MKLSLLKPLLSSFAVSLIIMSCKTNVYTSHSVSPMEIATLNTGMTKGEALGKLGGTYPFDILASDETGCEIHQYKYRRPLKWVTKKRSELRETLRDGQKVYERKETNAYLVFKGGRLDFVLTDNDSKAEKILADIAQYKSNCTEQSFISKLKGCMDKSALNYNDNAKIDNGTCEYCPCGYEVNKSYNTKRPTSDCNQKCIETTASKLKREADEMRKEAERVKKLEESRRCTNCDLIEKLMNGKSGNLNFNIDLQSNLNSSSNGSNATKIDFNSNIDTKKLAKTKKQKSEGGFALFKKKSKKSEESGHVSLF